jgi:hypothetical protein
MFKGMSFSAKIISISAPLILLSATITGFIMYERYQTWQESQEVEIDQSAKLCHETEKSLESIVGTVNKVTAINQEISNACFEQSNGIAQINVAMSQLDESTQQNASTATEASASSEELSAQAVVLQELVGKLEAVVYGDKDKKPQAQIIKFQAKKGLSKAA